MAIEDLIDECSIREMVIDDYERSIVLWKDMPGIGLSDADNKENIEKFLKRNSGLSFVCEKDKHLIGTILCGHDDRRGNIYHLAVSEKFRKMGIGKSLTLKALDKLSQQGIQKCHLFLYDDNELAMKFYEKTGWWKKRDNLLIYSMDLI